MDPMQSTKAENALPPKETQGNDLKNCCAKGRDAKNTFVWNQDDSSKIFPIDYSEREFAKKMCCGTRKIRSHILNHSPMKDLLQDLITGKGDKSDVSVQQHIKQGQGKNAQAKKRPPNRGIAESGKAKLPLPLEAILFLKCYLELESTEYKNVFEYGRKDREERISSFVEKLCKNLCKAILPRTYENDILSDAIETETEFIRHKLFQNQIFGKIVLDGLWEDLLYQRIRDLQMRAKYLQNDQRTALLKDLLVMLDLYRWGLPTAEKDDNSIYTEKDLIGMFESLLACRNKVDNGKRFLAAYSVYNSTFKKGETDSESTMSEAFDDFSRCGKRRTKTEYNNVRAQYLKDLGASVKISAFEKEFLNLNTYLTSIPHTANDVKETFIHLIKEWGREKIDYCRAVDFACLQNQPLHGNHADALLHMWTNKTIYWLYPAMEVTRALYIMKYTHYYDNMAMAKYLRNCAQEIRDCPIHCDSIESMLPHAQAITIATSTLNDTAQAIVEENFSEPLSDGDQWAHYYAESFFSYFKHGWSYLFQDSCALEENGAIDINKVVKPFLEGVQAATNFFGQSDFFPYSEDKIKKMFESWGAMLSSSNNAIMLNKLLEFSPDILLGLLLQTLHKFACNCNYQTMLVSLITLYGQSLAK